MTVIRLVARSPRMVALCLPRPGARYRLDPPADWRLVRDGATVSEGAADRVVLPLDGLEPATRYSFECAEFQTFSFETPPCAGRSDIRDFGAVEGSDDPQAAARNASAIVEAIAATPNGGTVLIPPGTFYARPVALRSDLTLHLAGTLCAPSSREGWPILPAFDTQGQMLGSWEGLPEACFLAPLHAIGAKRLTIAGSGILDGGGDRGDWWIWAKQTREGARRPRGLHLVGCTDITLLGFTIRNAPSWTIHPQGCDRLNAACLHIQAPHVSPNTDGFDPEMCRDVEIIGARFSVGDDCIAIKAGKRGPNGEAGHLKPTERISVRHCLMERGHGGVVIGSEMSGDVTGVTVEHCEMEGTDRGLRIKTRRGRGGRVDDIVMSDVTMNGVLTAFSANGHYHCDPDGHAPQVQNRAPASVDETTPQVGRIRVENIEIRNLSHALGAFLGLAESPFGPITLENVRVLSLDPNAKPAPPVMADHVALQRHAGLITEHAEVHASDHPVATGGLSLESLPEVL